MRIKCVTPSNLIDQASSRIESNKRVQTAGISVDSRVLLLHFAYAPIRIPQTTVGDMCRRARAPHLQEGVALKHHAEGAGGLVLGVLLLLPGPSDADPVEAELPERAVGLERGAEGDPDQVVEAIRVHGVVLGAQVQLLEPAVRAQLSRQGDSALHAEVVAA
jgi:hypothetical protein